jgi:hypothetical protein
MWLLWIGHAVNKNSVERIMPDIEKYPFCIMSNFSGAVSWSLDKARAALSECDVVLMPATESYKSANRTVDAILMGCFVVAEPHPSLMDIPGIYIGNIKEGLEWLKTQSVQSVNERISLAQNYVMEKYAPKIMTAMWRDLIQSLTTSAAEASTGAVDGSTLTPETVPISDAIYAVWP